MLEYSQTDHRFFERPAGRFNTAMVRMWDDLIARCGQFGLRILLAPWDNFWMARRWHRHPYNRINGGPAAEPGSFFTDDAVVEATARRLRFVVERWGGSGVIAAWDLFNEIHPYWGGTPREQAAVITRLSDAVREAEQSTWGFTRPQTVSIFGPEPDVEYEDLIFRHPSLDFATTHIYEGPINFPLDTVKPAVTMAKWIRHARARIPHGRPFVESEHGPIHMFNDHRKMLPEPFDDEYERHLMWAHLASGGAGSGMRWPARHPHVLTPGMKRSLAGLAAFTKQIDWRRFAPREASDELQIKTSGIIPFACRDERQAVIWLLRRRGKDDPPGPLTPRPPLRDVPVTLPGLRAGEYCVEQWDTSAGCSVGCIRTRVGEDGRLRVILPLLGNDRALAVRPCESAHQ
jgi:mannan endo-1,4-beta-mannosidase